MLWNPAWPTSMACVACAPGWCLGNLFEAREVTLTPNVKPSCYRTESPIFGYCAPLFWCISLIQYTFVDMVLGRSPFLKTCSLGSTLFHDDDSQRRYNPPFSIVTSTFSSTCFVDAQNLNYKKLHTLLIFYRLDTKTSPHI